jgi:hypothetical protein
LRLATSQAARNMPNAPPDASRPAPR